MRTAHRCGVAVSPKSWQRFAIPRLGCCGGQAIRILRRHAAGWQPNQLRRWLSSGLNSKTEWPWLVGIGLDKELVWHLPRFASVRHTVHVLLQWGLASFSSPLNS